MSTTEKIRLRGLVARTRVIIVDIAVRGTGGFDGSNVTTDTGEGSTTEADTEMGNGDDDDDDEDEDDHHRIWEMEVARVYERTIIELGIALDAPRKDGSE